MLSVATISLSAGIVPTEPFVLLVDDHEPSLRKLQALLESVGYSCVSTLSPSEALSICDQRRPSVVVTDLAMPRLDGHGLARGIKARYPGLPVLLVTGEALDVSSESACRRSFAGVYTKPIDVEPFLDHLGRLLPPSGPRPAVP
jgi:CheY-like chemotaxis protein